MTVTLPESVVERYPRFSLYNSPYSVHDRGHAIDLYPESNEGISPVSGTVRGCRTVGCPTQPYAVDNDHVIVIDVDDDWCGVDTDSQPLTARILHVDPSVRPGDRITVGESLGSMVRSGFFGRWVDNHVHLEFRPREADPYRARGSCRLVPDVDVAAISWDGEGTVRETDPASVLLDEPTHPDPGERYVALGSDGGLPLDGGLAHYAGGGVLTRDGAERAPEPERASESERDTESERDPDPFADPDGGRSRLRRPIELLGQPIGTTAGRDVSWGAIDVLANGDRITGLSLFATRRSTFGIKLVCPDHDFSVGESVRVRLRPSEDPIRLSVGR